MMVNGVPRWTCRTHISKVLDGDKVSIAPLRNLPIIKDLVVDMDPFFDKWVEAEGVHHGALTRHDPIARIDEDSVARQTANAGIECINCVEAVHWNEELGLAQAMWVIKCNKMGPFIVASDLTGECLFERENAIIAKNIEKAYEGTKPAILKRYGETDDRGDEVI